jgi:hypothetical protein
MALIVKQLGQFFQGNGVDRGVNLRFVWLVVMKNRRREVGTAGYRMG